VLLVVGAGVVVLVVLNTVVLEVLTGLTLVEVGASVVLILVVGLNLLAKLGGMKPSWLVSS
jgi:hypothetical protein